MAMSAVENAANVANFKELIGHIGISNNRLKQMLPIYMVPAAFVLLDALPLTLNGKVDRKSLSNVRIDRLGSELPDSPTQEILARIWCDILQLDRVGIHDNFFEIGGHSLLLTRVLARINDTGRSNLTAIDLFKYPTIYALARHIDGVDRAGTETELGRAEFEHAEERVKRSRRRRASQQMRRAASAYGVNHHD